jgi:hypothetical protein
MGLTKVTLFFRIITMKFYCDIFMLTQNVEGRLTESKINPLLHNGPADIFSHSVLQCQELAEVAGAQVSLHYHQLAAPVVIVEHELLTIKGSAMSGELQPTAINRI